MSCSRRTRPAWATTHISFISVVIVGTTMHVGCAARKAPAPEAHHDFAAAGFVDLQPGWRLRVVTPVTKSGRFTVTTSSPAMNAGGLSVQASDDFIGYEVSYYSVIPRSGGGVAIRFESATVTQGGKKSRVAHPLARLFELPAQDRFARLLFLTRVSPADHDQGIVAAPTLERLKALTTRVQADPERNCTPDADAFCAWVPIGIAVQPEQKAANGKWVAAT